MPTQKQGQSANNSQTGKTFRRHVAPFAPVALALLMNGAVANRHPSSAPAPTTNPETENGQTQTAICEDVTDSQDCHSRYPTGCSAKGGYDAYLNLLKDLALGPPASTPVAYLTQQDYIDLDDNTPQGLSRTNHETYQEQLSEMGEGQTYGLIGYLYYYEHTGAESSNCDLTGPRGDPEYGNVDYHIGIGFDATMAQSARSGSAESSSESMSRRRSSGGSSSGGSSTGGRSSKAATPLEQDSVIVEMTPHTRFQFQQGVWTLQNLQKAVGRQVRVVGQLMIDNEHNVPTDNCAIASTPAQKQSCWRFSIWELHPVQSFQVCAKTTNDCTQDDTNWVELNKL
jgi:hypothetical protein